MKALVELLPQRWLPALALLSCVTAPAATLYVWQGSPNPASPYTNWATAATNIQDAVDAAQEDDTVLVTNGVYATGGRPAFGLLTNRVVIDKPVLVQSVNGPAVTVIEGAPTPGGGNGNEAIRCAHVGTNAALSGFTLTNGHTRAGSSYGGVDSFGGGSLCERSAWVSNSVLTANSAGVFGGGIYGGVLWRSTLSSNLAWAGGGACTSMLHQCLLQRNQADNNNDGGGGAYLCLLDECTITENSAPNAGGVMFSTLRHCIVSSNTTAPYGLLGWAGGAYWSTLYNCLLYGNRANWGGGLMAANSTTPLWWVMAGTARVPPPCPIVSCISTAPTTMGLR